MTARELMAAKAAAKAKAEVILNLVASASRKMTDTEQKDFDASAAEVARIEDLLAKQSLVASWGGTSKPTVISQQSEPTGITATAEYKDAFYAFARRGNTARPEILAALGEGSGAAGGYLVPVSLDNAIQQKAALQAAMRRVSRVIQTTSDRNFALEGDLSVAAWTVEADSIPETTPTFDRVTLKAYKIAAVAKVDAELLYDSAFNLEGELASQFGRAFGIVEEAAFISGDGNGKPTGVTTVAPVGVHAASPSAITADEVIGLYHSLNPAYRAAASWVLNDSTALQLRKLKFQIGSDAIGYIWQPGLQAGTPDRLLGQPVYYSAQMPILAASNVSIVFGDFASAYVIADRVPRTFQRLVELYAGTDQIGFRATQRVDGNVVKSEAVTALRQSS
jgi:HK97 family phage major capsid protein